jgi:hypothetical protein
LIKVAPGAGPVLLFAADELRRHAPWLEQATVAIGPAAWALDAAGLSPARAPGHRDGFLITGDGARYALAAGTERGALYAVYALLEQMGARWPHPGLAVPPADGALPAVRAWVEPGYDVRGTWLTGPTTTDEVLALIAWSGRRGLNALHVADPADLDTQALQAAAERRGIALTTGSRPAPVLTQGRCFHHSLGNPYGCAVNPPLFRQITGKRVAAEPYADLLTLGRPANLATVIRQDLEDYFRESHLSFYLIHNGPLSWWTCPLNFDVYARTLWDLNTDPAEALEVYAAGDDDLERTLGRAEEAAAAALSACDTLAHREAAVTETSRLLPAESLERAIHTGDWAVAVQALEAMPPAQRGRFGDEVFLPLIKRRLSERAAG